MTNETTDARKMPYQTPELVDYGSLVTTTQAGAGAIFDITSAVTCADDC